MPEGIADSINNRVHLFPSLRIKFYVVLQVILINIKVKAIGTADMTSTARLIWFRQLLLRVPVRSINKSTFVLIITWITIEDIAV